MLGELSDRDNISERVSDPDIRTSHTHLIDSRDQRYSDCLTCRLHEREDLTILDIGEYRSSSTLRESEMTQENRSRFFFLIFRIIWHICFCLRGITDTLSYSRTKSEKTILTRSFYIFQIMKKIGFFGFFGYKVLMKNTFWSDLASRGPIAALAPMDGYCDSPYRQIVKKIAPNTVVFSEFYSADGLVHSKELQRRALTHDASEYPLIIQIFGKDPAMFAEAARIIEGYGITGIDINMGCPAKKVVKSGHGSSLMINRDTAFSIVSEMAKAVKIPVSVKTRLGWENPDLLVDFVK